MSYLSIAGIIVCVTSFICGVMVMLKPPRNMLKISWFLFNIFVSMWGGGLYMGFRNSGYGDALFWMRFLNYSAIFIPLFFLHFVYAYCTHNKWRYLHLAYASTLVFFSVALLIPDHFVSDIVPKLSFAYYPDAGWLYYIFPLQFGGLLFYALHKLFQEYEIASPLRRNQIRYLLAGYIVGFSGGATTFPLAFNIPLHPFGAYFFPAHIIISTYAIIRYRLMDIKIAVTRAGLFLIVYTLVLGLPFWLGSKYGFDIVVLVIGMLFATLGPLTYGLLKKKAENILLSEQRQYQNVLMQASRGMVEEHNLDRLLQLVVRIIKRAVKLRFVAAYISEPNDRTFVLRAIRDTDRQKADIVLKETHPLIEFLDKHREPFLTDELDDRQKAAFAIGLETSLIVPSFVQDKCLGFLVLGRKINGNTYTNDDMAVFKTLANQAALAIENSLFIQDAKHTQELLFNAEKLAAIGGMADGLAHQIKNRLYEFSIVSQNMEYDIEDVRKILASALEKDQKLAEKLDDLTECTKTMIKNVKKTNLIIQGILDFARTEQNATAFSRFPLKEIIEPSMNLVMMKHQIGKLPLTMDIPEDGTVYGVKGQLQECIYNCLDNAYEAVREKTDYRLKAEEKENYHPRITVRLTHTETSDVIEISDNGVGIKDTDKAKIFAAFFTTKPSSKSGSGIGNYVGKRMIEENHHGKMKFISKHMEGTTFYISLPKK